MHYSSHPPCMFHNRIAKTLGVLVGAALIATLGLPSAVQAQTPPAPTVTVKGGDGKVGSDATINATWFGDLGHAALTDKHDGWLVEYTEPGELWDDATAVIVTGDMETTIITGETQMTDGVLNEAPKANDPRIHHGVWKFRVSYFDLDGGDGEEDDPDVDKGKVLGKPSALAEYRHGPPASPTGLNAYPAGPTARSLIWDKVPGAKSYQLRYSSDPDDDDKWGEWKTATIGMVVDKLDMGVEYTFEVRAFGKSRAGVGDLFGPSASTKEMMPPPPPTPTPTLPEIAALFLAMLLLGSGAYLLRRRQSGGLTPA